ELRNKADPLREPVLTVLLLSRACRGLGDVVEAERVLRLALTVHPDQVVLLTELGRLLEGQTHARLGEAIECYRAVRALRPETGLALGRALSIVGRIEEGESLLRELTCQRPRSPEAFYYLGTALSSHRRYDEAIEVFKKAIGISPLDRPAQVGLG